MYIFRCHKDKFVTTQKNIIFDNGILNFKLKIYRVIPTVTIHTYSLIVTSSSLLDSFISFGKSEV